MKGGGQQLTQAEFDQTIMINKTMFEDKMYVKTNISGKDLQRAIHRFGIYEARLKEAQAMRDQETAILKEKLMSAQKQKLPLSATFKQDELNKAGVKHNDKESQQIKMAIQDELGL